MPASGTYGAIGPPGASTSVDASMLASFSAEQPFARHTPLAQSLLRAHGVPAPPDAQAVPKTSITIHTRHIVRGYCERRARMSPCRISVLAPCLSAALTKRREGDGFGGTFFPVIKGGAGDDVIDGQAGLDVIDCGTGDADILLDTTVASSVGCEL